VKVFKGEIAARDRSEKIGPNHLKMISQWHLRALTPLIYSHVTPYGTFRLDMNWRLAIEQDAVHAMLNSVFWMNKSLSRFVRPKPRRSGAIAWKPFTTRNGIWLRQRYAESGHPWSRNTGLPLPWSST
jgi:hypothetical protein